jgi:hypothetical protein
VEEVARAVRPLDLCEPVVVVAVRGPYPPLVLDLTMKFTYEPPMEYGFASSQ